MIKHALLATVGAALLAGVTVSMAPAPAEARSGCSARAELLYPYNRVARKAYRQRCKARYRVWRRANRRDWLLR